MYATILTTLCSLTSAEYDEITAYKGVMYSAASYCAYRDIDNWDCGTPCSRRKGI